MAQVINTNVMSLNAQRQLNKSQLMQNQAMERLSSGLRINSAKDDAAGLGISTGMTSQVKGLNQAVRNANDGISMAQTAEGAMDEMTNILQRMRELSVQAANDTNSASNRASIQAEVDQLYSELDRIAGVTEFNGISLLDGSNKSTNLQIGANSGQSLSFSIDAVTTKDLNLNAVSGTGELNGGRINDTGADITADVVKLNGVALSGATLGAAGNNSAEVSTVVDMVNAKTGSHGVQASGYNAVSGIGADGKTSGLTINGTNLSTTSDMNELMEKINRDVSGVTASLTNEGGLSLTNDTGNAIVIGGTATGSGLTAGSYQGFVSLTSVSGDPIEIELDTDAGGTIEDLQAFGFNESTGSDKVNGQAVSGTNITESDAIQINGVDLGAVGSTASSRATAAQIATAVNAISEQTGVSATASTEVEYEITVSNFAAAIATSGIAINNITLTNATIASLDDVVTEINGKGVPGLTASVNETTGKLVLTSAGSDIKVNSTAANVFDALAANTSTETYGAVSLEGENGKDVLVTSKALESNSSVAFAKLGVTDQGGSESAIGIGLSVTSVSNAENSIDRIDDALNKISEARGKLGAVQNRLQSTISNLSNVSQNLSAANSRVKDADFATETSKLSKSQILSQAGTSMLAQANASGQSVLSLLG